MTKEEAKEILTHNWTRVDNPNYSESELDEAFFMAIEALQAQPTHGRLIDADALLEAVDGMELTCDGGVDINDLEGLIQEMAAADMRGADE